MYILIFIIIFIIVFVIGRIIFVLFKDRVSFFITGLDAGFSFSDLVMLWNVSEVCDVKSPTALFYSLASLSQCMTKMSNMVAAGDDGGEQKTQTLLTKLFDYRTKLQNISDEKKGITTTRDLEKGQKLRIVLSGKGVFSSEILSNGNNFVISVPKKKNIIVLSADEWVGDDISVYFWRKGDARYVFDTTVLQNDLFLGEPALFLKHSSNLLRTQKRKSVRAKCKILGMLFIMNNNKENVDYTAVETKNGYKCLILDISESGALVKIGGKGIGNINIKIQYTLNNRLIVMYGIVRTVEYHKEKNQSLLHFECTNIEPDMKNEILSFVYNTVSEKEKEAFEAISQTDLDSDNQDISDNSKDFSGLNNNIEKMLIMNNNVSEEEKKEMEASADIVVAEQDNNDVVSVTDDYSDENIKELTNVTVD